MRFVDVKNDIAFRKIFGSEKKKIILISFLNAVLGLEGHDRIQWVTLLNPFQLPRVRGEKATIIDVKAVDENGSTFIIEMQVAEKDGFDKRILYYTTKDYAGQILSGEDYPKLRPVYFIGVLDFEYFKGPDYLSTHLIMDEQTKECVFNDMKFRFIELPKFNKEAHELETVVDKWAYFLKNAKTLEVVPEHTDDEGLREAYEEAERYNWTKEEFDAYIAAGMRAQDARGEMSFAIRKATAKAAEEAAKRTETETIRRVILGMHANGVPIDTIAKSVGISEEAVRLVIEEANETA